MSTPQLNTHPKVFVSYSHDSISQKQKILALAERLRTDGFETMVDQYVEGTPPQGWPRWMLNQIDWADYVLLICTKTYYRRFLGRENPEVGKGVDWEGAIITNELYNNKHDYRRFVPVIFDNADSCYIPDPVRSCTHYFLANEENYDKMTDFLAGAAGIQPVELGPPPNRTRKAGVPLSFVDNFQSERSMIVPIRIVTYGSTLLAPGGAMRSDNNYYIEREADQGAKEAAERPCETIVVKGPRQYGKSTLLARYLGMCRQRGKSVISISFGIFEESLLSDYRRFLSALACELARCLKLPPPPTTLLRQQAFNAYVETTLLPQLKGTVVFGFDDTDHIMRQSYSQDFFSMLRMWHDKRADSTCEFSKLGLALATSTEPKLYIKDPLKSPFNVVAPLQLEPFSYYEAAKLNSRYGGPLSEVDCSTLCQLVSGHPFFIHEAFYRLCGPSPIAFPKLMMEAASDNGPFREHLRAMLSNLKHSSLLTAMKHVIQHGTITNEDDFYRLEGAGLVRRINSRVSPSNLVYADFFRSAK